EDSMIHGVPWTGPMTAAEAQSPLDAARKLAPQIRACADAIEAARELPRPLFEALADAGLFHLAVPRALGWPDLDLPAYLQVIENGRLRLESDGQPERRYFFVPVAEAELLDTWHVRGMRGTGTHHFAVNDVFVPADRTVLSATAPLLEARPLYQIPRTLLFASGDAAVAVGMARACLDAFFELAGVKTPRAMAGLLRDQPMVQADVGHAEADLRAGRALLTETVRDVWAEVSAT